MVATPLSLAILQGMDPSTFRNIQNIQNGESYMKVGQDASPTTRWGAIGRLANAAAGSYIQNSALSDLAKTLSASRAQPEQDLNDYVDGLQRSQARPPMSGPALSPTRPPIPSNPGAAPPPSLAPQAAVPDPNSPNAQVARRFPANMSPGGTSPGALPLDNNAPSPLDTAQYPAGPVGAPSAVAQNDPVAAINSAIAPRGIRNNNPLNIEDGPFTKSQPGYAGSDGRFAKFETPEHGVSAANALIDTYGQKHGLNTVAGIVGRWAPTSDGNNVSAYAADVAGKLGIDPNAPVPPELRPALVAAMAHHENGVAAPGTVGGPPVRGAAAGPVVASDADAAPVRGGQQLAQQTAQPDVHLLTHIISSRSSTPAQVENASALLRQRMQPDSWSSVGEGYLMNGRTGEVKRAFTPDDKTPTSVSEYNFYRERLPAGQEPMDYATFSTAKARAGATNIANNVDMNSGQSYDKQLAEGLGKSHAALANGVEDAQARARDLAAMQGAVDQIQRNGGTTGGMGQEQIQNLKKTINAGTTAMGIEKPFSENDISDKEFLQKFNRQIAGAQAKGAVGNRVTNFEMSNYLKANPGLDMSLTGNQRLLGIQSQIEQRNIAVGNGIRDATAAAISKGQKIDPVTVQKIIADYDEQHHVKDPVNGQDLTQSYTLPEFQGENMGTNKALDVGHETNINGIKIKRVN